MKQSKNRERYRFLMLFGAIHIGLILIRYIIVFPYPWVPSVPFETLNFPLSAQILHISYKHRNNQDLWAICHLRYKPGRTAYRIFRNRNISPSQTFHFFLSLILITWPIFSLRRFSKMISSIISPQTMHLHPAKISSNP